MVMHTLTFLGNDTACSRRWQRLAMHMAAFPAGVQRSMAIRSGRPNRNVRVLR